MTATLIIDGHAVTLTEDLGGLVGRAEIDGRPVIVHANITECGPKAVTPAKWCAGG